jgi:signal transduction histidine kinase
MMANDHIRPFSLIRLSFIAIGVFVLSSALAVMALFSVQISSQSAVASWRHFADQASVEQRALRAFVTQAGVGGLIDGYYRLAATGDENLLPMVYGRGGAAYISLSSYPIDGAQESEVKARATLQELTRAYVGRVAPLMAMHRAGRPAEEILAAAELDSKAATGALQTLAAATARSMMVNHTLSDTKALILLDVRRLLGLEGLVHNANRYLVGASNSSLGRVRNDVADMKIALERYGRHSLTAEEAAAFQRLAGEIDGIEPKLIESRRLGKTSIDTAGIQASIGELEKIVYAEAVTAQDNLQTTLDQISAQAGTIIVLVIAGVIILLAGSVWLLLFRIGRRIKAITQTMRALAAGRLDAEIPGSADHDEIGDMSRALLVFRDNMRANAALTTELAENSRLASLGAMVAGMAHELNTPIGNALSVSSTLEEQCKTFRKDLGSERLMRSALERHAASLEEATGLIQRNLLRAAAQIGSFKQVAVDQTSGRRREFHLDDVLASVVQSMAPQLKRTPFTLACGEASGAVMESYPGALSQVVTNLIENALKHGLTGQGSGRVDVMTRRLGPHFTEIIVSDNGVGIPEEVKPSIFNAFFTTKAGKGGSGLGLHIVKSIVCGPLGGQISVHSEPGKGSRFIITLPNKAPAEPASTPSTERTYYAAAQHAA